MTGFRLSNAFMLKIAKTPWIYLIRLFLKGDTKFSYLHCIYQQLFKGSSSSYRGILNVLRLLKYGAAKTLWMQGTDRGVIKQPEIHREWREGNVSETAGVGYNPSAPSDSPPHECGRNFGHRLSAGGPTCWQKSHTFHHKLGESGPHFEWFRVFQFTKLSFVNICNYLQLPLLSNNSL